VTINGALLVEVIVSRVRPSKKCATTGNDTFTNLEIKPAFAGLGGGFFRRSRSVSLFEKLHHSDAVSSIRGIPRAFVLDVAAEPESISPNSQGRKANGQRAST